LLVEWGEAQAFLDLVSPSNRGLLKPVGGSLVSNDYFDTPLPPPTITPPKASPPPPPLSAPPQGPPPQVPPEVLERFEQIMAQKQKEMDGSFAGGTVGGSPPAPPPGKLTGLPAVPRGPVDSAGNTDSGANASSNPLPGIEIPDLPGINPGQGPPTPPPNIEIPEIPDFPRSSE
jgi:hypothetical protein